MLGEQAGGQRLAVGIGALGDDAEGHHGGQAHAVQVAQGAVLPERDVLDGLLDGVHAPALAHDPHHVP